MAKKTLFHRVSKVTSRAMGHPVAFTLSLLVIVAWAATGPFFGFNDAWQLTINTATTIVTFLMVFLIQSTQNRDAEALQLKLDELIRAVEGAHNALLDLEELSEKDLDRIKKGYLELAERARKELKGGRSDTGHPDVSPEEIKR